MPRIAVSINPVYASSRMTPRVGATGRRVRDLGALVERNEPGAALRLVRRGLAYMLTRVLMLAVWCGCFLVGAIFYIYLRFY